MRIFAKAPPRFPVTHPPLHSSVWLIAEDAIRLAWFRLLQLSPTSFDVASADEDAITLKLHEILVDEVYGTGAVAGFDDTVMQVATREAKFRNFNGKHPDKMPDLHIGILNRRNVQQSQDGIFVECKPVDANHTVGVHYCDKGIIRFVQGDYAWAMPTAMMVAYAAEGYSVDPKLKEALARSSSIKTICPPSICPLSESILFSERTHITVHRRDFRFVENGESAGNITLRHLWLRRQQAGPK